MNSTFRTASGVRLIGANLTKTQNIPCFQYSKLFEISWSKRVEFLYHVIDLRTNRL